MWDEFKPLFPSVRFGEPLSLHTSWGIGGPAEAYLELENLDQARALLEWVHRRGVRVTVLGQGSNVLVSDAGIRGVVVRLKGEFEKVKFNGDRVRAGAGALLPPLAWAAAERGLSGAEPLCGIPGTVGGALMTNAGTPEGDVGRLVREVEGVDTEGRWRRWRADELEFSYRRLNWTGATVFSVDLQLRPAEKSDILAVMDRQLKRRAERQPLGTKNCGSVFKNPPGDHAARLIEAAGFKGAREGGARVSPKHANFIENVDRATASDVRTLMERIQKTVERREGVRLQPEVWFLGD